MYSAGILPFTIINNEIYILLGRETYDKTYSDFGGKYDSKGNDISILHTAFREFTEESLYNDLSFDEIMNLKMIYTESRTLRGNIYYMYLLRLTPECIYDIISNFHRIQSEQTCCFYETMELKSENHLTSDLNRIDGRFLRAPEGVITSGSYSRSNIFEKDRIQLFKLSEILDQCLSQRELLLNSSNKDVKDVKDVKDGKEVKEIKDVKELKHVKEVKEVREVGEVRQLREIRDIRDIRDLKDDKDDKEDKDVKEINTEGSSQSKKNLQSSQRPALRKVFQTTLLNHCIFFKMLKHIEMECLSKSLDTCEDPMGTSAGFYI